MTAPVMDEREEDDHVNPQEILNTVEWMLADAGFNEALFAENNLQALLDAYAESQTETRRLRALVAQHMLTDAPAPSAPVLDDPGQNHTVVAHDAPSTSNEAAWAAWPNSGTQRNQILRYIASQRRMGCTDDQAAVALGMNEARLASRRRELWVGGWIEPIPPGTSANVGIYEGEEVLTRLTRKGCHAVVWCVTDKYDKQRPL